MEESFHFTTSVNNTPSTLDFDQPGTAVKVSRLEHLAICSILVWNGICSMTGNGVNLLVVNRVKSFKRNMKIFLVILSAADFATGFFLVASTAVVAFLSLESETFFCKFSGYFMSLFPFISSLCIFEIALDKFLAIFYPFRYTTYRNMPLVFLVQSILVGCALLLWSSHLDGGFFKNITFQPLYGICLIDFGNRRKAVSIVITGLSGMGVHLVFTTIIYMMIAWTARRQATEINKVVTTVQTDVKSSQLVNEWRGFVTFLVVTLAFFVAWIPFWVIHFLLLLTDVKVSNIVYLIGGTCTTSNSYWNPIIYTLGNGQFRKQVKLLLFKCRKRTF